MHPLCKLRKTLKEIRLEASTDRDGSDTFHWIRRFGNEHVQSEGALYGTRGAIRGLERLRDELQASAWLGDAHVEMETKRTCAGLRRLLGSVANLLKDGAVFEGDRNKEIERASALLAPLPSEIGNRRDALDAAISFLDSVPHAQLPEDEPEKLVVGKPGLVGELLRFGEPVEMGEWLPNVLDPTPNELHALQEACCRLAGAVQRYHAALVGERISEALKQHHLAAVFVELLEAWDGLGAWSDGDGPLAHVGLEPEIVGWPEAGYFNPLSCFAGDISDAYRWIYDDLVAMGFPVELSGTDLEVCVAGSEKVIFHWRSSVWHEDEFLDEHDEPRSPERVQFPADAVFVAMRGVREPCGAYVREGCGEEGEDDDVVSRPDRVLYVAADAVDEFLAQLERRFVRDSFGLRRLRLNLARHRGYRGYSYPEERLPPYLEECLESDPFDAVLSLEAATRTRLKDGGDPVWFLEAYQKFKRTESKLGRQASFMEYCRQRHSDYVDFLNEQGRIVQLAPAHASEHAGAASSQRTGPARREGQPAANTPYVDAGQREAVAEAGSDACGEEDSEGQHHQPPLISYSEDFKYVTWGDREFERFSPRAARAVAAIYEATVRRVGLPAAEVRTAAGSDSERTRDVFKTSGGKMHPAWKTMIVRDHNDRYWIAAPPQK